jgi:hypothetical protein
MIADIRGYSRYTEQYGDEAAANLDDAGAADAVGPPRAWTQSFRRSSGWAAGVGNPRTETC